MLEIKDELVGKQLLAICEQRQVSHSKHTHSPHPLPSTRPVERVPRERHTPLFISLQDLHTRKYNEPRNLLKFPNSGRFNGRDIMKIEKTTFLTLTSSMLMTPCFFSKTLQKQRMKKKFQDRSVRDILTGKELRTRTP